MHGAGRRGAPNQKYEEEFPPVYECPGCRHTLEEGIAAAWNERFLLGVIPRWIGSRSV